MDTYVCQICGYVAFNEAPGNCPVCGATKDKFKLDANAIKKPAEIKDLTEKQRDLERKHIPVIKIVKKCGLVENGCIDAHISVGTAIHVMELKHFITYIDVYHDYSFIARYHMVPEKLNPVLSMHLKVSSGKLLALENCNVHGRWVTEISI